MPHPPEHARLRHGRGERLSEPSDLPAGIIGRLPRIPRASRPFTVLVGFLAVWIIVHAVAERDHVHVAMSADHGHAADSHGPEGHEAMEGLALSAAGSESVTPGPGCTPDAPVRSYDIVAIAADITLNRYLDHDPEGRMYVLAHELDDVREEEAANAAARSDPTLEPRVSLGLQGDAIQPLTLRALPGDCLRLTLRNDLPDDELASLHLHRSSLRVEPAGRPAVALEASALAGPGETVSYSWAIPTDQPEGTHYFHSEGDAREQTAHGLFGALIVEPPGSRWLEPLSGAATETGWQAIIEDPAGPDFREFALYYHEIGDEATKIRDRNDAFVPVVDPITKAYRPAARALAYRSEPFYDRLALQASKGSPPDESLAYSSYTFGDPATPIARSYLGDPVKQRVIHAGSEVAHVHHVHGGSIRWRRDIGTEDTGFATGLQKHPPLVPEVTERTDSQSIGPSETFDLANECGSGGCQGSVGDYLFHCHIAHHYFAGMWGIWRVYGTAQDGPASTDSLPPLQPLPDRADAVAAAVTSNELIGRTIDPGTGPRQVTDATLEHYVERQLPPRGVPGDDDATVLDWTREGDRYLGEPETSERWPGYASREPGERPPLLFDPRSGRLAFPFLRPHLGQRPPFAPEHGPSPYLDPPFNDADPRSPGSSGPASLCPRGTRAREVRIEALSVPVALDAEESLVDPHGQLYTLRHEVDGIRADPARRVPLVIRANAGEECLDVTLTSRLDDRSGANPHGKVGLHVHFVQFDVQGSDGLDTGFNYEQTVRPYTRAGWALARPVPAGAETLHLTPLVVDAPGLSPGALVAVGIDHEDGFEARHVVSRDGNTLVLDAPLRQPYDAGTIVSPEFVRYRWYPDAQVGTTYFHDHVNALSSWRHGLFGALIVEPPGSTYHDPYTGARVESGLRADIHTRSPVGVDVAGSFREFVVMLSDGTDIDREGRSTGSSIDLRAEPLRRRGGDPAHVLDSRVHGDPATPVFEAFVGDPLVVRALVPATNDIHTLHLDGHPFRLEPWNRESPPVSTVHVGISERYDLVIPAAGGPGRRTGDYLYRNGRPVKLEEGSWGILRVLDPSIEGDRLKLLPGRPQAAPAQGDVCPPSAPVRRFDVHALAVPLPMTGSRSGRVYVLAADRDATLGGTLPPRPLVLHVRVGDCVDITLVNELGDADASFHADQLVADPATGMGLNIGRQPTQTTKAGSTRTYRLYADPSVGETVALVTDGGDVVDGPAAGLYGAIVVAARDAAFLDPTTGLDASRASRAAVVVRTNERTYRDVTLFLHDTDDAIGTHRMPYTTKVSGPSGLDYRVAGSEPSPASGDPATPIIEAFVGDPLRIHVLAPVSEQAQVFSVEGHAWPAQPNTPGTALVDSVLIGGLEGISLDILAAGGPDDLPGDYLYGDHRLPYREAGLWGILRVHETGRGGSLRALDDPALVSAPARVATREGAPAGHDRRRS